MKRKIRFALYLVIAILSFAFIRESHRTKLDEKINRMATKDDLKELEESIDKWSIACDERFNELEERMDNLREEVDHYIEVQKVIQGLMINLDMNASEFDDYIEYLKELRTLLPVSEQEEELYPNTLSIGDPVLLDGELYESGYDLVHEENGRHAYYGNKEIRLINGVVLSYDGEVITAYTMKEVEEKMEEEYKVEGYSLINRFSGDALIVEGNAKPNALTLMSFR